MNMQLSLTNCDKHCREFSLTPEVLKKNKKAEKRNFSKPKNAYTELPNIAGPINNFSYKKIYHFVDDTKLLKGRKAKPKKVSLTTSRVHDEKAHTILKKQKQHFSLTTSRVNNAKVHTILETMCSSPPVKKCQEWKEFLK